MYGKMTRKSEAGGYKNVTYLRQSHVSETRKETHLNIKTFEFIEETKLCMTVTQTNEWPDNRNHRLVTVSVKDSIPASRGPRQSRGENCKMIDSRHRHSPLKTGSALTRTGFCEPQKSFTATILVCFSFVLV